MSQVEYPDDPGLVVVLKTFGVAADRLLGHGGEAWVYALDAAQVLRVLHAHGDTERIRFRQRLVDELMLARPAFALPKVLDVGDIEGRAFAIERRLPGRSVIDELRDAEGRARSRLIEAHLEAAAALGNLYLEPRGYFGDLIIDDAIRTATWREYLSARVASNLARSVPDFHSIDPAALADPLPEGREAAFVHLDAFAGNMLTDGSRITAVLDVGPTSVVGDRRLDPVAAAVYLVSPEITPVVTPADADVALSWLRATGRQDWFDPTRRWLAGFWSFAIDDPRVLHWCRDILLS